MLFCVTFLYNHPKHCDQCDSSLKAILVLMKVQALLKYLKGKKLHLRALASNFNPLPISYTFHVTKRQLLRLLNEKF